MLLVGTLYAGENEFGECLQSILRQSYQHFEHVVLRDLPNRQAHATLFQSFLARADEFDVLVKVDADMVLAKDSLFTGIVQKLERNSQVQVLSIAVHDFFSDELIWGLNAYRNTVRWDFNKTTLFVDRPDVPNKQYLFDDDELAPAAYHCKNPSALQALHYGVHRGLKALQPKRFEQNEQSSRTHWRAMERTWQHFLDTGDTRLGVACIGAELAYRRQFSAEDLDYSSAKTREKSKDYGSRGSKELLRELRLLRFLNFSFLPARRRRQALRLVYA